MKPGTIGRLGRSSLLVYVERVTPCAAYLVVLPEQCDESSDFDYRFIGPHKHLATSPFADIYTVDLTSLSEANLDFLDALVDRQNAPPATSVHAPATIEPTPAVILKAPPALHLEVVRVDGLGPTNLMVVKAIKQLGEPTLVDATTALSQQFKLTVAAYECQINNLVKLGFLRWK